MRTSLKTQSNETRTDESIASNYNCKSAIILKDLSRWTQIALKRRLLKIFLLENTWQRKKSVYTYNRLLKVFWLQGREKRDEKEFAQIRTFAERNHFFKKIPNHI